MHRQCIVSVNKESGHGKENLKEATTTAATERQGKEDEGTREHIRDW